MCGANVLGGMRTAGGRADLRRIVSPDGGAHSSTRAERKQGREPGTVREVHAREVIIASSLKEPHMHGTKLVILAVGSVMFAIALGVVVYDLSAAYQCRRATTRGVVDGGT